MFSGKRIYKKLFLASILIAGVMAAWYGMPGRVAADTAALSETKELHFAQMADGGGFATQIILSNPGEAEMIATLEFFKSDGSPLTVILNGATDKSFTLAIKGRGALFLKTSGAGAQVATGWARVRSSGPLGGSLIYSYMAGGKAVSEAGLDPSTLVKEFCFTVDTRQGYYSGLAVANPNSEALEMRYLLYDANGNLKGQASQTLGAMQHASKLIEEIFPNQDLKEFTGTVAAYSTGGPVASTTLRFDEAMGSLASVPIITGIAIAPIPTTTLASSSTTLAPITTLVPTTILIPTTTTTSSGSSTSTSSSSTTTLPSTCAEMATQSVAASLIGLPTGGAIVTSATLIKATDAGNTNGEYCKILGSVKPSATAAVGTPDIQFQLNLPSNWNGKSAHFGGGGYNGTVIPANTAILFAPGYVPLAMGYVTFGSDSGHVGNGATAAFALNEGTINNFGYEHIKKIHDTAFELIRLFYAKIPSKSYFVGASTGGREGMTAIQRFPQDYDGVIATSPALNFSGVRMHGVKTGQAAYTPGGFINPAKQKLILKTTVDACDLDDGAADRIVSNIPVCRTRSEAILAKLRCATGKDEGDNCLSDTQMQTLKVISDDLVWPYKLAYGVTRHQGYNILQGADFSHATNGLGSSASAINPPTYATNGRLFTAGDNYFKYFITKSESYDSLLFDLNNPGPFLQRMIDMSDVVGAMNPDMENFRARGGKLLMMHGLADETISPNVSIAYYEDQVGKLGKAAIDAFWKFYQVPGFGHNTGVFIPSWNAIGVLDDWVTKGIEPGILVGTDMNAATSGRTRPFCQYPSFPKYTGSGSLDRAENYTCTAN